MPRPFWTGSNPDKLWLEFTAKDGWCEIFVAEFAARVTGEALVSFERCGAISDLISRSVV